MRLTVIFYALYVLLVCSVETAHAGPLLGAVALVGKAITAISASGWLGGLVVGIGKSLAMGLLQQAIGKLTSKKQKAEPVGVVLETQMGDDQPLSFVVGLRATAGKRKYWGTWGSEGKTPNAYYVDVLEVGALPSYAGERGLAGLWVGETVGTVLWDQPHPDGRGFPITEFRKGGVDYAWAKYLDGTQTVADPYLRAKFGAHPERPFLATMIGRGKQVLIITCRLNNDLFSGGAPSILAVPPPLKMYDLRRDSTAGGDGPHRWSDPTSWSASYNNAVIIYNIARGITGLDGQWVYGGQNVTSFRLPSSSWMAAMNECDRVIDGRPQFRAGAEISVADEPLSVIEQLRLGCNGRFAFSGSTLELIVGAPGAAVFAFTDEMTIVSDDAELDPWPSLSDTHNTITASYPDPASRWASKDAPEYSVEAYVTEDGRFLSHPVQFRATPYPEQVQALRKTIIEDGRRFRIHEFTLGPIARLLKVGNVVSWTSGRNAYTNKLFIIERIVRRRGSLQRVILKELEPTDYDPPQFYIPPTSGWVGTITVPAQPMTGWTAVPAQVEDADGEGLRPAIEIGCGADMDDVDRVHVMVRFKDNQAVVFDSDQTPYPRPGSGHPYKWTLSGAWCLPLRWYQVAGKFVPKGNRPTIFGEWIDVLTPNIRLGDVDVYLPGMVKDLQKFVGDVTEFTRDSARQLMLEQQRLARLTAETDVAAYTDRQKLRRELVSTTNAVTSRYLEEIELATGPGSSLAKRTQTLEAVIPTLATATAFNALVTRVTSAEGVNTAQALAITSIQAELPNKASASALSSLATTVTDINGKVNSQADALTSLSAGSTSGDVATANFRMRVTAGPAGYASTIAMEARSVVGGVDWKSAGFYIDVPAVGQSRFGVVVDQFFISSGAGDTKPFVFENGKLTLALAAIKLIQSGRMESLNGKMKINLDLGTIEIFS